MKVEVNVLDSVNEPYLKVPDEHIIAMMLRSHAERATVSLALYIRAVLPARYAGHTDIESRMGISISLAIFVSIARKSTMQGLISNIPGAQQRFSRLLVFAHIGAHGYPCFEFVQGLVKP